MQNAQSDAVGEVDKAVYILLLYRNLAVGGDNEMVIWSELLPKDKNVFHLIERSIFSELWPVF